MSSIAQEVIAKDIIDYCKEKKKRFLVIRWTTGKIIYKKENRPYTSHELSQGTRCTRLQNYLIRISKNRWEVNQVKLNSENSLVVKY